MLVKSVCVRGMDTTATSHPSTDTTTTDAVNNMLALQHQLQQHHAASAGFLTSAIHAGTIEVKPLRMLTNQMSPMGGGTGGGAGGGPRHTIDQILGLAGMKQRQRMQEEQEMNQRSITPGTESAGM